MNILDTGLWKTSLNNAQIRPLMMFHLRTLRDITKQTFSSLSMLKGVGPATLSVYNNMLLSYGLSLDPLIDSEGQTRIHYDGKNGLVFPEEVIPERIEELLGLGKAFTVGGSLEITYLRVLVKRGRIKNLVFLCAGGQTVTIDSDGNIVDCPAGFANGGVDWLMELF